MFVPGLWMVVVTGDETLRMPGDWLIREAGPVEVPTATGPVDLRDAARAALDGEVRTVYVDDGRTGPFTLTLSVGAEA